MRHTGRASCGRWGGRLVVGVLLAPATGCGLFSPELASGFAQAVGGGGQGGSAAGFGGMGGQGGGGEGGCVPSGLTDTCGDGRDDDCDGKEHPSECLVGEDALIVRYFLDDQEDDLVAAGTRFGDSGPTPALDLTATLVGPGPSGHQGSLRGVGDSGHRGLSWDAAGTDARLSAPFTQTSPGDGSHPKLLLTGSALTIELVATVDDVADDGTTARLLFIGTADGDLGNISLTVGRPVSGGTQWPLSLSLRSTTGNPLDVGRWNTVKEDLVTPVSGSASPPAVLHLVLDGLVDPAVVLYLNGNPVMPNIGGDQSLASDYMFTGVQPEYYLALGNREAGARSMKGSIRYAALYGRAFSAVEAAQNAKLLQQSDDRPPK